MVKIKGLSKYVNDTTKELSLELIGTQYKGILSNKMKISEYLVKPEQKKIHLNQELCEGLRNEKDKIHTIIYEALIQVN